MITYAKLIHPDDPDHLLHNAISWAMEAGRMQLEKFRDRRLNMTTKSSLHDVVTEVDKACETFFLEKISATYPTHGILGEETGAHNAGDWMWVIDPLDGTNNYSQGLPIFCVSVGIQYRGVTQIGVVYVPYLDEIFTAKRGEGALWNGKAIRVAHKSDLNQCVIGTGFPYDKGTNADNNLPNVNAILPHIRGIRRMGAAAYDLCCVACGLLDGYWELDLKPWDACAGSLIVEEAGGRVVPFRDDRGISIVAGGDKVVNALLGFLH